MNLNNIHALIIDMDGVLWLGDTPLPGLSAFFDFLHNRSLPFMLATNNSSKTPTQYQQKFAGFGIKIGQEQVMSSSLATAAYLKQELEPGVAVYVIGHAGIREALRNAGFLIYEDSSQPVAAVVSGIDFDLTYDKLRHATHLINQGAGFIGTNGDLTFPTMKGKAPGTGAILAAIEAATATTPTIIGKPGRLIFEAALQKMGSNPQHTAMLGDRLETDIIGGQRAGLKTILVTTGIDNEQSIARTGIQPDMIVSGLDDLLLQWRVR